MPYAFRRGPLLARAHTFFLQQLSKFLWPHIHLANLSCVVCFPVPSARVPGVECVYCTAIPTFQPSASRYRCFTSPPQAPCPVNLGSMRASGGTWRPYPRRCGDQADPPMMVEHSLRSTHNHNAFSLCCLGSALSHVLQCPQYDDPLWG